MKPYRFDSILTPDDARRFVRACVAEIGPGFHCDTRFGEYIDDTCQRVFGMTVARHLDALLAKCFELLGDDVYSVAVAAMQTASLDEYGIDADQPTTCPMCGRRTEFDELPDGSQRHRCACDFEFIGTLDDDDDPPRCRSCGTVGCDDDCTDQWGNDDVESQDETLEALRDCVEQLGLYLDSVEDGKDDAAKAAYQRGFAVLQARGANA